MSAADSYDVYSVYTVSWEVHDGARWKKVALAASRDKAHAEEWAEKTRTNPRARTRNVVVTEQRVREVRTAVLPYWVAAGEGE